MADVTISSTEVAVRATPVASQAAKSVLELRPEPDSLSCWLREMWRHRAVLGILARKDFQVRYKRASLGVLWAVTVPLLQAAVMALVFSHFVHIGGGVAYGAFVMAGVLPWGYVGTTMPVGATSIVDAASLTDKVWFPRAVLAIVPCLSGLVGLAVSMLALLVVAPVLGADLSPRLLLLVPACALLIAFTIAISLVLSALQVYFRDVRFIVSAGLLVWIYLTPIMYPKALLGHVGPWLDLNPLTGVVELFHVAVIGPTEPWLRALVVSIAATVVLLAAGIEIHRRNDRLFVDLL